MADFCKECSVTHFGEDFRDLAGLSSEKDTKEGLFAVAICEGCGYIQVDHTGKCIGTDNCLENHKYELPQ